MDMKTLLSFNWGAMMPEFIILGVATALCIIDLLMPDKYSRRLLGWFAMAGVSVAIISLLSLLSFETTTILYDTFRLDAFAKAFKLILLFGTLLVLLLAESYRPREGMEETRGEFYYLFLTALLGAMMMASSGDLITLFVGLELLSVSSYILAGIRKRHAPSNEAAMKYVINGSIATAVTLFGMSYLYGLTGTTNLKEIGSIMDQLLNGQFQYLFGIAFFMMMVGFSFKIAAAPFHMWAPDVYQGSPAPVTAFLSVISKTAGFIIILRMIIFLYVEAPGDAVGAFDFMEINHVYIAVLAGATMIIGNVVALRQSNMKRMLAYSSIAHAGYTLVAVATIGYFTSSILWFYLVAYMLMNVGAFAVLQYMQERTGSTEISSYAGLYKKQPFLAVAMSIFLLSLASIPGTAGFIGKMYIFIGIFAVNPSNYVLAAVLIGTTVISYVYYFAVMKQMFFRPVHENDDKQVRMAPSLLIVIMICALGTIILGLIPWLALDFLGDFNQFDDFVK